MSRQTRERRLEAEDRWPRLRGLVSALGPVNFQDSLKRVIAGYPLVEIGPIVEEWKDWNDRHGWRTDADTYAIDGLGCSMPLNDDVEARAFMNSIYDRLKESSRTMTASQAR